MSDYVAYLDLPAAVVATLAGLLLVLQIIGKLLEVKGKTAPEIMRLTKWLRRKKQERKAVRETPAMLARVEKTLNEFSALYSTDNIKKRNAWMEGVDHKQAEDHAWIESLSDALSDIKADLLSIRIEDMRSAIIGFASYVADGTAPVTREQFNRIFKMHADYEAILTKNGMTNGETATAMLLIKEAYETHMREHSFIEIARGYESIM